MEYVGFQFFLHPLITRLNYVSRLDWLNAVQALKQECNVATTSLIQELEQHFPTQDIMNATRVIYP